MKKEWKKVIAYAVILIICGYLLLCIISMSYVLTYHKDARLYECIFLNNCKFYTDQSDPAKAVPRVCTLEEDAIIKEDPSVNFGCQIGFSGPFGIPEKANLQEKILIFLTFPLKILYDYTKNSYH